MKLFYSYMWHLIAHIPTFSEVVRIQLKIFSPADQWHRLVMPGRCFLSIFCFILFSLNEARPQSPEKSGTVPGKAEIKPLIVGQIVPDEFWSKKHLFYVNGDTVRKDLSEYRGKLLVLDSWATWCAICLAQMKEKQELFSKYPKETKFLLVNSTRTKDSFENISNKEEEIARLSLNGNVETIIHDSYLEGLFPTKSYPRYTWIGPYGNVVAFTMALSVTEGHLKDMLDLFNEHDGKN